MKNLILFLISTLLVSCSSSEKSGNKGKNITIDVLPFSDMPQKEVSAAYKELKTIYPNIVLLKPIALPKTAYYAPRNRYRADSIIAYLKQITPKDHVTIGLTSKDISHTKGDVADYGIMGLAWTPGNSCVVSSYRVAKANKTTQFYKLCIHELGHTTGLPHCSEKTCYMRDAEGGNPLDEETGFCKKCKAHLVSKGWSF